MKFHKLYWLIWFFVQRIRRQLGGITRWERKDPQATSRYDWEWCMFLYSLRELKDNLGRKFSMTIQEMIDALIKACRAEIKNR